MAAGMSIKREDFDVLKQRLNEKCKLTEEDFVPIVPIDIALPIGYIHDEFLKELEKMEPLGKGNVKPVFAEQHFRILRAAKRGKENNVLVMNVENEQGTRMDALLFDDVDGFEAFIEEEFGGEELEKMYHGKANNVDVAFTYYPSVNEYNGMRNFQIIISNFCHVKRSE